MRWLFTEKTNQYKDMLVVMYDLGNHKDLKYALEYIRILKRKELLSLEQQNLRSVENKVRVAQDAAQPKEEWFECTT